MLWLMPLVILLCSYLPVYSLFPYTTLFRSVPGRRRTRRVRSRTGRERPGGAERRQAVTTAVHQEDGALYEGAVVFSIRPVSDAPSRPRSSLRRLPTRRASCSR